MQRVWLALEEKKIQYQYIEGISAPPLLFAASPSSSQYILTSQSVNPYHKPKSLLDLNPRGLVPTLQYHNRPLYESTVLCEFLEEAYADHTPRLQPADPYERTRIWTDFVTSRIIPAFHRFLQYQPARDGAEGLQKAREEYLGYLKEFAAEMDAEGPYFLGGELSLIDIAIAPWAVRLWVFDHFKEGGVA